MGLTTTNKPTPTPALMPAHIGVLDVTQVIAGLESHALLLGRHGNELLTEPGLSAGDVAALHTDAAFAA